MLQIKWPEMKETLIKGEADGSLDALKVVTLIAQAFITQAKEKFKK